MGLSTKNDRFFSQYKDPLIKAFECEECGAERMETESGRVCPNFHGRIHRKIPKPILKHLRRLRRAKSLPMVSKCKVRWSARPADRIKNTNVFVLVGSGRYEVYKPLSWEHLQKLNEFGQRPEFSDPISALKKIISYEMPVTDDAILEANYNGEPFWLFRVGYVENHWPRVL